MAAHFTRRELDVMSVLWDLGSATVKDVQEALEADLAYTTVLTLLRILEGKGHVSHEQEGRAYRYYPLVQRQEAGATALRQLVRKVFRGSPEALLTQLVSDQNLSEGELRRIREVLDGLLREDGQK